MKKNKPSKETMPQKPTGPGYAAQDFLQGKGGAQSGHNSPEETFNQFENKGDAGFASETGPGTAEQQDKS